MLYAKQKIQINLTLQNEKMYQVSFHDNVNSNINNHRLYDDIYLKSIFNK